MTGSRMWRCDRVFNAPQHSANTNDQVVVAGRNSVTLGRKTERAERLFLHYAQRWAKAGRIFVRECAIIIRVQFCQKLELQNLKFQFNPTPSQNIHPGQGLPEAATGLGGGGPVRAPGLLQQHQAKTHQELPVSLSGRHRNTVHFSLGKENKNFLEECTTPMPTLFTACSCISADDLVMSHFNK